ncbi:hypothetical protein LVJ83_01465 [Uruburuella testudinis]|uniref:Lipoprotein n=1 Tax=Uruburuella testudinis TaxID=1282863 RepID=A0ABY4DT04_9NEIS|nr:hypothetical protein [Uruburuella testudinis]UOO82172.1 hypothetical protein LVJ83_01465 [Uruburuella testudinis]
MFIHPKTFAVLLLPVLVSGCLTLSGHYELKAFDHNGKPALGNIRSVAQGSGIYSARNAMCSALETGATIRIYHLETGKELASESPYHCRRHKKAV